MAYEQGVPIAEVAESGKFQKQFSEFRKYAPRLLSEYLVCAIILWVSWLFGR